MTQTEKWTEKKGLPYLLAACLITVCMTHPLLIKSAIAQQPQAEETEAKKRMPQMRAFATVTSNLVMLSDIFRFIEPEQDVAVFRAPDLGQTGIVSTKRVIEAAQNAGLKNVETSGFSEISVSRQSIKIEKETIDQKILTTLSNETGIKEEYLQIVTSGLPSTIHLDPSLPHDLHIQNLINFGTGFTAAVTFGSTHNPTQSYQIEGKLTELADVVTLSAPVRSGEELTNAHLQIKKISKRNIPSNALITPSEAIGMVAKRTMRPDTVIKYPDIEEKRLVYKDEMVLISYSIGQINLTVKGKALEDGKHNEMISVKNLQSDKRIDAVVVANGHVSVIPNRANIAQFTNITTR